MQAGPTAVMVAAVFQPLRRRVQAIVDKRCNRARYDARRVVELFAHWLRADVDLTMTRREVHVMVRARLDPSTASVPFEEVRCHRSAGT